MATAVTPDRGFVPPTTGEGLLILPDNVHGEIVNGVFVEMRAPGGFHGSVTARVGRIVGTFVETHNLGDSFGAETAFRLRRWPDLTRCPDYAVVVTSRVPALLRPGVVEGGPDLADDVLDGGDLLPGFSTPISALFAGWPPVEMPAEPAPPAD